MKNRNIHSRDISIVVQGAVSPRLTSQSLKQLRKLFPESEIILSTWEDSDTKNLNYDILVLNVDPGGYQDRYVKTFTNNTLRQLVSTQQGIAACSRKFVLKIRSDLIFKSTRFLDLFEDYPIRDPNYTHFSHRVIVTSFFSKKYLFYKNITQPVPFHISDWLAFEFKADIEMLYNIPLPYEPDFSWYLFENKNNTVKPNLLGASHRYAPEQYITVSSFQKNFTVNFSHYLDYTSENIDFSNKLIANNFIIVSPTKFKFYCGKKKNGNDYYKRWTKFPITIPTILWRGLYRPYVFAQDYKKYCDPQYNIPLELIINDKLENFLHKR